MKSSNNEICSAESFTEFEKKFEEKIHSLKERIKVYN